jgi:lipid-binding SYLF domain-containing protein
VEVEVLAERAAGEKAPAIARGRRRKVLAAREQKAIREEVAATMAWLKGRDPGLEPALKRAYAYAIFPAVGRASLVLGGAHGYGEVFEQGSPSAFASVTQVTVGVQLGGQTFSEILSFVSKESLNRFKSGLTLFAGNLSAVFVRGASGTLSTKGVDVRAYSRGGMLLEASLGGQKFRLVEAAAGEQGATEVAQLAALPGKTLRTARDGIAGAAKSAVGFLRAHRAH